MCVRKFWIWERQGERNVCGKWSGLLGKAMMREIEWFGISVQARGVVGWFGCGGIYEGGMKNNV